MSRGLRLTPEQFASKSFGAKKPKYGNRKKVIDGIEFASTREALRWQDLALMQKAGEISHLRRQVPFEIEINGILVCTWFADFTYIDKSGIPRTEDSKGCKTPVYRLKKKLVEAEHGIKIRET